MLTVVMTSSVFKFSVDAAALCGTQGEARSDLHTLSTASRLDVIRGLFGPEVAASLLPLELTGGSGAVDDSVALDGPMGFTAEVRTQKT